MTSRQASKGKRGELELAHQLTDLLGKPIQRRLQEGRSVDTGDLEGLPDVAGQCKNYADVQRASREAIAKAAEQKANSGARWAVGFVRRPGGRWIAVMELDEWCSLYREATA